MNSITITGVAALWLALTSPVFRCESPGEPPLFSDLPCPHGTTVDLQPAPLIQSVGTAAPPGPAGYRALAAPAVPAHGLSRRGKASRGNTSPASRHEACDAARSGLRAVQMQKRRGYSIAEAAQLEDQLREFREDIRAACW